MDSITAMAANPPDGIASVTMKEPGKALTDILHNSIVLTFMLYRPNANRGQNGMWFSRATPFRVDTETERRNYESPRATKVLPLNFHYNLFCQKKRYQEACF